MIVQSHASANTFNSKSPQASQQRDLKPSLTSLSQSLPTASSSSSAFPSSSTSSTSSSAASQSSSPSQLLHNLPPGISVQKGTEPQSSSPSQVTSEPIQPEAESHILLQLLQKLPPGITIQKGLQESLKPQSPVVQHQGSSSFTIQVSYFSLLLGKR